MNKQDRHRPSDLEAVLAGEPRHEAERLREAWELIGSQEPADFPDPAAIERVWQALESGTAADETNTPRFGADRAARGRRVSRRPWMALAATLLVGVAVGVALWLRPVVETAAPGQRLAVTLPDGSQVELNSGTTLRYARRFGQERLVHLDGEAFFDVAEVEWPFVVRTFNAQITVLGTRFNVRAWPRSMDPGTAVTLEAGRVLLAPAGSPERAVALAPGQTRRILPDRREAPLPDTVAAGWATAWRRGDLVFKDQWLGVILEDVERRFAVDVAVEPFSLRQRRLTLAWRSPSSAEAVIRDVTVALGLNYRETSNGYEIYAPLLP